MEQVILISPCPALVFSDLVRCERVIIKRSLYTCQFDIFAIAHVSLTKDESKRLPGGLACEDANWIEVTRGRPKTKLVISSKEKRNKLFNIHYIVRLNQIGYKKYVTYMYTVYSVKVSNNPAIIKRVQLIVFYFKMQRKLKMIRNRYKKLS